MENLNSDLSDRSSWLQDFASDKDVVIGDMETVKRKCEKFARDGAKQLLVIADFDRTITSSKSFTSHGVIERSPLMPQAYRDACGDLVNHYGPMESNDDMKHEEKEQGMVDWWRQSHDLMTQHGLTEQKINACVQYVIDNKQVSLRHGCAEFMEELNYHHIPLLILSAGLYDTIERLLRHHSLFFPNTHILANRLLLHRNGNVVGFQTDPMMHSMNKAYQQLEGHAFHATTRHLDNVLLLGDNIADAQMTKGLNESQLKNVLRVGFLNSHVDSRLETYKAAYDIVIINDGSFDFVRTLLHHIVKAGDVSGQAASEEDVRRKMRERKDQEKEKEKEKEKEEDEEEKQKGDLEEDRTENNGAEERKEEKAKEQVENSKEQEDAQLQERSCSCSSAKNARPSPASPLPESPSPSSSSSSAS